MWLFPLACPQIRNDYVILQLSVRKRFPLINDDEYLLNLKIEKIFNIEILK